MPRRGESDRQRWDRKHSEKRYDPGIRPTPLLQRVVDEHHLGPGTRALDLACGRGRNALFLAERGLTVTAVDVSEVALEHCRRAAQDRGVEIETVRTDLTKWDLGENRWGLIVDTYFLDRRLLHRAPRALRPGGLFVLEHFTVEHPAVSSYGPTTPDYLLELGEARTALKALEVLVYDEGVFDLGEGTHSGRAGLVRCVGRRS